MPESRLVAVDPRPVVLGVIPQVAGVLVSAMLLLP
jgi:hypothetical protein